MWSLWATTSFLLLQDMREVEMARIDIFTDGGCSGNPGPGGWAFVVLSDGQLITTSSGSNEHTTNNIMELNAVINALDVCTIMGFSDVNLHTDSQYVKNGITDWIKSWKARGWKTASKDPVKNRELWEKLDGLNSKLNVTWTWVKGHAGIKYNEMCDSMVRTEMQKYL